MSLTLADFAAALGSLIGTCIGCFLTRSSWRVRIARAAVNGGLIEIGTLRYRVTLAERKDWKKEGGA